MVAKNEVLRDGWDIQEPNFCASRLWRGIVSSREAFGLLLLTLNLEWVQGISRSFG